MELVQVLVLLAAAALLAAVVYLRLPGGRLWEKFRCSVKMAMEKPVPPDDVLTVELLSQLPQPMQQYFDRCGYIGRPLMKCARVVCRDVAFRMGRGQRPVPASYEIFLFAGTPDRLAFLNTGIYGVPFHGMDYYLDGEGYFTGVLAKRVQLFQSRAEGEDMGRALLVTVLAEAVFLPSLYLSPYVMCTGIDDKTVGLTIECYGLRAEGTVSFNDNGEIIAFTTDNRIMDDGKGGLSPERWTLEAGEYRAEGGIRYPHRVRTVWNLAEGDNVYFDCGSIGLFFDEMGLPEKPVSL